MFGRARKQAAESISAIPIKADDIEVRAASRVNRKPLGELNQNTIVAPSEPIHGVVKKITVPAAPTVVVEPPVQHMVLADDQDLDSHSPSALTSETEERLYMRREADDIDARDKDNPLLCVSVVNEMYDVFFADEKNIISNTTYMETSQPHINERMRCILVDWLVEVHLKFKMVPETLYLTIQTIDRFLEHNQVRRSKLQLVGVAALLIGSKYEEIYPPEMCDLVYITDRAYSKQEILEMENQIVTRLEYKLTVPTIHSFLCRFLKAAHADRTMVQLACYLAERTLQEYTMVKHLPSVIAASSVYIARKSLRRHPWSPTLVRYTKYDEEDLMACVRDMQVFLDNSSQAQQAVMRKYSSPKFGSVAKTTMVF